MNTPNDKWKSYNFNIIFASQVSDPLTLIKDSSKRIGGLVHVHVYNIIQVQL